MVCKEEVFNWFKELSGAKRIELMCGLMSMCIPLEIRFFEAIIRDLAKKDLNALREAELKANSFTELDTICKCDLLADKAIAESNDMKTNTNCEIPSNALTTNCTLNNTVQQSIQSPQVMPIQDMTAIAANGTVATTVLASNEMIGIAPPTPSPPNSSSNLSQLPSRSKLIVSLCLLSPTNRNCSTIAYKALRQQLTAKQIAGAVVNCFYRKGVYTFDDLFSEILLLLTMALHHPAFSYEQRDILAKQKEEVELTIDDINSHLRQSTTNFANAHHFQQSFVHQSVHPSHVSGVSHIHQHIGPIPTQPHLSPGVGGRATHSHSHNVSHTNHPNVGQLSQVVPHQPTQQYPTHTYMPGMPVTVTNYTSAPLPNMANLRISSVTSPVSTPSPTNSPSSSKSTVTSVATISPLPITGEFVAHGILPMNESAPNQAPYVLTAGIPPPIAHQTANIEDIGCAKTIVSCYNCGTIGHRGDECTAQSQEEANR